MSGQPGKETGNKHWITLIVHKDQDKVEYIVADSGGNKSRLKDPVIWTLIKNLIGEMGLCSKR